jgi:4-amino-4-deoxy-L-arabinose transferase-like glycosyltransferase
VAAVPVVYFLGREIFSRRAGLLAAFLLAINLFHIQYSQQARSYSLVVLLVVISFLSFLESVKQRPRLAWTICYVLSTTLALYAHFFTALVIVTQVILTLIVPDRRRVTIPQLARIGVVLVLGSPVLWFVLFRNRGQLNWIQPVHPRDLYHFLLYLTGSGVKFGIALIGVIVASKIAVSRWCDRGWNMQTWSFLVVAAWLFLPVCVTMLVSIWKPIYSPRFLIFCLPAALLLVAAGLAEITYPWITYALIAILAVGAVNPTRMYYADPGPEDWKSVVEFLSRNTTSSDIAYVPESYCALPLNYALNQASPKGSGLQVTSTTPLAGETGRIWIIECSVAGNLDPQPVFPTYKVKEVRTFTAVQIFELDKK